MDMNKTRILILDDDEKLRFDLHLFLEDKGYECFSAADSKEALTLVENNKFDIAIVDTKLPGLSGDEFIPIASNIDGNLQYIINTCSADFKLDLRLKETGLDKRNILRRSADDMYVYVSKIKELINNPVSL